MPRLKPVFMEIKANDGERYSMEAALFVNDDGLFSLTIPEQLEEICLSSSDDSVSVVRDRKYLKLKSHSKRACVNYLRARITEFFNFEEKEELVIKYSFHSDYAICEDKTTGEFHPNGYYVSGNNSNYQWRGNLHATKTSTGFSVKLYARIFTKTTFIRESSTKEMYEKAKCSDDSIAGKLQAFAGIREPDGFDDGDVREIPYSDEAAEFFYNSMIGIAKIGHVLTDKFSSNESVMKMIEGNEQLLIGNNK